MSYEGYLKPHLPLMRSLHSQGFNAAELGRELWRRGVRAKWTRDYWNQEDMERESRRLSGLVRHALGLNAKAKMKMKRRVHALDFWAV